MAPAVAHILRCCVADIIFYVLLHSVSVTGEGRAFQSYVFASFKVVMRLKGLGGKRTAASTVCLCYYTTPDTYLPDPDEITLLTQPILQHMQSFLHVGPRHPSSPSCLWIGELDCPKSS